MKPVEREIKRQKEANREGLHLFDVFESHRRSQTEFILSRARGGRLCVLGAGNCFDLELEQVASAFSEIHLVDIDPQAIRKARQRLTDEHLLSKVHLHAPVDVSGANKKLHAWSEMKVSPEALVAFPETATNAVLSQLPGPFDCVVSSCILSQILLTYRRVMGERHKIFEAGLVTLLVTHFRVLSGLTKAGGEALFITDVTTDEIAPLDEFEAAADKVAFLQTLAQHNLIFNYLNPALLHSIIRQDPFLSAVSSMSPPEEVWRWQNTAHRAFLVYGARLIGT